MSTAQLKVSFAGPLVTFQDAGRLGQLRFGCPPSGPMDRVAHAAANAAMGNPLGATCIEVSLGGLILECRDGAVSFAVAGGDFSVSCGQAKLASWQVHNLQAGERLTIRGGASGSWCYVAFAGAMQAQSWLGSTATHYLSGLGGGQLLAGQTLEIAGAELRPDRVGSFTASSADKGLVGIIRVGVGPQEAQFVPGTLQAFLGGTYRLTDAFDRMGVRLEGPKLALKDALSIPSEPILRGSVQVSGEGVPTVLLADHQTTGGYPKIATVLSCDTDRLAQMRSGDSFRFQAVTPEEAVVLMRTDHAARQAYLASLAAPRPSLSEALMRENLIGGVILADRS